VINYLQICFKFAFKFDMRRYSKARDAVELFRLQLGVFRDADAADKVGRCTLNR